MKDKRVVFMGTPDFSVPILEMLIEETNVVLVVTKEDAPSGRGKEINCSPIKKVAVKNNIEVFQPKKIREEYDYVLSKSPDIIITCAYGQIIPSELLYTPKYKAINVHASLLPKLRGGAPLHRCIIDGYDKTGITIMYMAPGMDDGDIIKQSSIDIDVNDNVGIIHDKLSILGRDLLLEVLPSIFNGTNERVSQNEEEVTFAPTIKREDEHIDFNKSAKEVYNLVRGLYPFPTAYALLKNNTIKICECKIGSDVSGVCGEITSIYNDGIGIRCQDKEIIITKIKPAGKREMLVKDYLNGIDKTSLIGEILC